MKLYVLVQVTHDVFEMKESVGVSKIKGVVSDLTRATAWTERKILRASGEQSVQAPDIVLLPTGYRYGVISYLYLEFELDEVEW